MSSVPNNFLGLEAKHSDPAQSKYVVLPIPYDSSTSFHVGTRNGPAAIIEASQHVETFDDETGLEAWKPGIATLDPLEPDMSGPEGMHERIFKAARRIVRAGQFPLALGGEHSVTSGLVRAAMTKHKKLSILQIDAHLDLRDTFHGAKHSHACVMRRCVEMGASVVPVGIRSVSPEENRYLKKADIDVISARDCFEDDDWVERVLNALGDTVYVTLDIDGFDPAFAPGTGTPEPGGLDWYQVTGLLRLVAAEKRIVGADVVEVTPIPGQVVTQYLAARLAYKLVCYMEEDI